MRFEIKGLLRETGEPRVLSVEAVDERAAVRAAGDQGIVVERCKPEPDRVSGEPASPLPPQADDVEEWHLTIVEKLIRGFFLLLALPAWFAFLLWLFTSFSDATSPATNLLRGILILLTAVGCTLCAQLVLLRGTMRSAFSRR